MTTYKIRPYSPMATCSSRTEKYSFVHDAPRRENSPENWESFDIHDIPDYIDNGLALVYENLERLADLSEPYMPSQASELEFMVEALIQARGLIE